MKNMNIVKGDIAEHLEILEGKYIFEIIIKSNPLLLCS